MNRTDFIAEFAKMSSITKTESARLVDNFLQLIKNSLHKGEDISIIGFGRFKVTCVAERTIKNPKTGEYMMVPASKRVRFAPGKELKEAANAEKKCDKK